MMPPHPFLVGVTGGIGSGKSTLCRFLEEMGCELFEADRVARELQLSDPEIIEGISALFGRDVYSRSSDGSLLLDRKRIAREVFSHPATLGALNRLIHPKVYAAFRQRAAESYARGTSVLVMEAAILFETGRASELDFVVVVAAQNETRIRRAVSRGLGTPEEVRRRMALQWPQETLVSKADYVVYNNASRDELRVEAERLFGVLREAAGGSAVDRKGKRR
ncbi:dephospho-CoA kinase [Chlorobium sp. N1]|uniref:dephospho-CoA kinase n=1 Tax=Chlorobium sp. N1 TaxID=2491138 RepID=UPI00103C927F|nr:dephospho-CoA kinase [Chlorobium sp. N1]TCD48419.1 dephospho-CoA kinase [Chlorobium sp. N1]